MEHFPGIEVPVVSTAGAGDAFLAGVLCGLCCGLPFIRPPEDPPGRMGCAMDLGTLVAAMSVTSPHSIHPGLSADALLDFVDNHRIAVSRRFLEVFRNAEGRRRGADHGA
jgi:sugar/nucleoside kinase (ribokinase family)